MMEIKEAMRKFWHIIWEDDSLKGWILSIVIIFIFIKFAFFPALSLVTGTSIPLAIVESCSMYHEGNIFTNFGDWWLNHEKKYSEFNISKADFEEFKVYNGFNKGDILFITGTKPENLRVGDIIIFSSGQGGNPIIHRIVQIDKGEDGIFFSTMGDNNNGQLSAEKGIPSDMVLGKASARLLPYAGWIKLIFYEPRKPFFERGLCNAN
jgi:signal peptidase I